MTRQIESLKRFARSTIEAGQAAIMAGKNVPAVVMAVRYVGANDPEPDVNVFLLPDLPDTVEARSLVFRALAGDADACCIVTDCWLKNDAGQRIGEAINAVIETRSGVTLCLSSTYTRQPTGAVFGSILEAQDVIAWDVYQAERITH